MTIHNQPQKRISGNFSILVNTCILQRGGKDLYDLLQIAVQRTICRDGVLHFIG
jgi:hypothetical protein